jgi:LemA protein
METKYYVIIGVALILLWIIALYNGLVRSRNTVKESWSDIDTELNRRYDLIPNLVSTVKGYASHEQETLDAVVTARARAMASAGDPNQQAADENMLVGALKSVFALAEAYPDLKANENFEQLQKELANTEDRIQAARRFFNANVRNYNNKTELFPSNLIAGLFKFQASEFFEIEETNIRETPVVEF